MRLDKRDGIGEVCWTDDLTLAATIEGFFNALRIMEREHRYHLGQVEDLLSLLKSFGPGEIEKIGHSLLDLYEKEDPADLATIKANLKSHSYQLHRALQGFDL